MLATENTGLDDQMKSSAESGKSQQSTESILIVDDDEITSRLYKEFFIKVGFHAEVANDGPSSIAILKRFRPNLVLLDIFLPNMNGVEVLKFIRSRRDTYDVPVIMFSTSSTTRHVDAAWRAGATKCLAKDDFDPFQLLKVVRTIFAEEQARENLRKVSNLDTDGAPLSGGSITLEALERENREKFLDESSDQRTELRKWWQAFVNSDQDRSSLPKLYALIRSVQKIAESAHQARLPYLTLVCRTIQVMLSELYKRVHLLNRSTVRTASEAIDLVYVLFETPIQYLARIPPPSLVLIIDEQINTRQLWIPFRSANLGVIGHNDFEGAVNLANENQFHLFLVDVNLAQGSRQDLWSQLISSPVHQKTPLVLTMSLEEMEGGSTIALDGGHGLIAKPFIPSEATLKALTCAIRGQLLEVTAPR